MTRTLRLEAASRCQERQHWVRQSCAFSARARSHKPVTAAKTGSPFFAFAFTHVEAQSDPLSKLPKGPRKQCSDASSGCDYLAGISLAPSRPSATLPAPTGLDKPSQAVDVRDNLRMGWALCLEVPPRCSRVDAAWNAVLSAIVHSRRSA